MDRAEPGEQREYTEQTPLLGKDGTVLEIRDMYAFCEYVENRW